MPRNAVYLIACRTGVIFFPVFQARGEKKKRLFCRPMNLTGPSFSEGPGRSRVAASDLDRLRIRLSASIIIHVLALGLLIEI